MKCSPQRSHIMRSVKSKNTGVEILVRGIIRSLGFRHYRLNVKTLTGKPDIVFRKAKKIIFVHGCFWHGHDCGKGNLPKSNIPFWDEKISRNKARDLKVIEKLESEEWQCLTIWQCETKETDALTNRLSEFLK
jgi:DNA mismatch endonuclease (patch repair protein)